METWRFNELGNSVIKIPDIVRLTLFTYTILLFTYSINKSINFTKNLHRLLSKLLQCPLFYGLFLLGNAKGEARGELYSGILQAYGVPAKPDRTIGRISNVPRRFSQYYIALASWRASGQGFYRSRKPTPDLWNIFQPSLTRKSVVRISRLPIRSARCSHGDFTSRNFDGCHA